MHHIGSVTMFSPSLQTGSETPKSGTKPPFDSPDVLRTSPCVPHPSPLQEPKAPPSSPLNLDLWPGRSELQCVTEGLYITNYFGAKKLDNLVKAGITHVIVCGAELDKVFEKKTGMKYLKLELADNTNVDLKPLIATSLPWIQDAIQNGGRVLVHCAAGASRSGTIAVAYIMATRRLAFAEALSSAQEIRPLIQPNQDFCRQLSDLDCSQLVQPPNSSQ